MSMIFHFVRLRIKNLLYPGIDFCLRQRLRLAKKHLLSGSVKTLDAGCGNGAFCFLCYKLGNSVTGIDNNLENIAKCIEFRDYNHFAKEKLKFLVLNIYDLLNLKETFEQIICFETLEHLLNDRYALGIFTRLLKPGGIIHLGVPNFDCQNFYGEKISLFEDGNHVRKGYTYVMIEDLVRELNLKIVLKTNYGGGVTRKIMILSRILQDNYFLNRLSLFKEPLLVLFFIIFYPFTYLDKLSRDEAISLYMILKK